MPCQWLPGEVSPACDWSKDCSTHGDGETDAQAILSTPMPDGNDANAETIGDYLITLLAALWTEGSDFNGKRPFGKSGWEYDIYKALIIAGRVTGRLDEDGYVEEVNDEAAHRMVRSAIESLRSKR